MKKRVKRRWESLWRWGLAFALAIITLCTICSCEGDVTDGAAADDATEARIEYLSSRVDELEQMLIDERSNSYLNDEVYRRRISELEERIKELSNGNGISDTETETEGEKLPTSGNEDGKFIYSLEGGMAIITGYMGNAKSIVIPSTVDGYTVERIADSAFSRSDLESIEVSEGIKYIGWFAFSDCVALRTVILPKSLQKADYGIFNGCSASLRVVCHSDTYAAVYAKSYGFTIEYSDNENNQERIRK